MKLFHKIFLAVAIGALSSGAVVFLVSLASTKGILQEVIGRNQIELAQRTMNEIDRLLQERQKDMQEMALRADFEAVTGALTAGEAGRLSGLLDTLTVATGPWDRLHLVDRAGTIVASSKGCTMDEEVPQEVVELARRAHTAFPTVPVLGSDIVRDCRTGQLYVLEVNAVGSAFHLDSIRARQFKEQFGIDLSLQFGGVKAVARGIHRHLCQANEKSSRRNGIRIHESAAG